MKQADNYILNRFKRGSGVSRDIHSPRTGEVIGNVNYSTPEDIEKVMPAISEAQKQWSQLTFKKRSEVIFNFRTNLEKYRQELTQLIVLENGKQEDEANAEVSKAIELCEFANSIPSLISGRTQIVSTGIEVKEVSEGVGIVVSITPFNFPLMVPMWTIPNTLVLGNAMIVKASEKTPLTLLKIAEILEESGCPAGIFNIVQGDKEIVEALCQHPLVDAVTFVGSTPIAKAVYRQSTHALKRCLALGGAKNHILVTDEVDPVTTAAEIIASAFGMSGQRCMAASVVLFIGQCEAIKAELIRQTQALVCGQSIPPLVTSEAVSAVEHFLDQTPGKILVDGRLAPREGHPDGYYIGPSIVEYQAYQDIVVDEVFGPTLEILQCDSLQEALDYQNDSPYGNGASIFTDTGRYAQEACDRLSSGMLGVNIGVPVPRDPFSFGGLKASKFGVGDITGYNAIPFLVKTRKITTKWNAKHRKDWMS